MKNVRLFNCVVFVTYFAVLNGSDCKHEESNEFIVWKEGRKIEWSDFQGKDFVGLRVLASSSIGIKLDYKVADPVEWFNVECVFFRTKSTTKKDNSPYILEHEQGHFDIGEIFARKLRKHILSIKGMVNSHNYSMLDSIQHLYLNLLSDEQDRYDKETEHSNDTVQQRLWVLRIRNTLDSFKAYSRHKYH